MSVVDLVLRIAFGATPTQLDALIATAPQYLTPDKASEHVIVARLAAAATGTDPALLLAIAWHESNYIPTVVTREPGRRVSCGVMTPIPHRPPCRADELTLMGGYLVGAGHLRDHMDAHPHSLLRAVVAYAGAGRRAWAFGRQMVARSARIRQALSP